MKCKKSCKECKKNEKDVTSCETCIPSNATHITLKIRGEYERLWVDPDNLEDVLQAELNYEQVPTLFLYNHECKARVELPFSVLMCIIINDF